MKLATEQKELIKQTYQKYFNESLINYWETEEDANYMWFKVYLGSGKNEWFNTYDVNDCFHIRFELRKGYNGYELIADEKSYFIKPIYHTYLAYDRREISFRKTQGDFNKIIQSLDKFFKKLHDQFKEDLDNNIITDDAWDVCQVSGNNVSHAYIGNKHLVR